MADLRLAVIVAALVLARALFVLARPTRPCPRCHGTSRDTRSGRPRPCKRWRCQYGHVYRFGAITVHRLYWAIKTARSEHKEKAK